MVRRLFVPLADPVRQARRGVEQGLAWSAALAVNFLAAHLLFLPLYLTLLALAGAVVLHAPQTEVGRGARATWVTVLVGLAMVTAVSASASAAGANDTQHPQNQIAVKAF